MRSVVVVGGGQGGFSVVETLRTRGYDGRLCIVESSDEPPYRRPPLSKEYLVTGDEAALPFRPDEFYRSHEVDLLLGTRATGVDHRAARLLLADGTGIPFDHLVVATGARPRPWDAPGATAENVHTLATLADARRLRSGVAGAGEIVVIGGGFIGLEFASYAAARGARVTVLEAAPRLMARALSPLAADCLLERHRMQGVQVRLGVGVAGIDEAAGRARGVHLTDGQRLPADLVLVGIGSVPAPGFLDPALIDAASGAVLVDDRLVTADPRISAVGDVAAFPAGAGRVRLESVQNAADQGRCVAARLTGQDLPYRAVPWFWTEQAGTKLQMAGLMSDAQDLIVRGDPDGTAFTIFGYRAGALVAAESFAAPRDHVAARRILAAGLSPTPEEIRDVSVDLVALARPAA